MDSDRKDNLIKKKTLIILAVFTIAGFILRLIAALNIGVFADDTVYASQSAGIIGSGVISTNSNPPLFFYLTDLAYNLFGHSTFASRFWPLIAGTLLIPLIFLIVRFLSKDDKIALASSFFTAFCTFLIRMTFAETALVVLFIIMFSYLCGLYYIKTNRLFWLILFSIGFGVASLTKYSAPFFFIAFCIFLGYFSEKNPLTSKIFKPKRVVLCIAIILLISTPFLAFNYFIYKDKGILDVYFSRIIPLEKTQQLYGDLSGQSESLLDNFKKWSSYSQYKLPIITDPIITLFGLAGVVILLRRKDKVIFPFFLLILITTFLLQSAGSNLQKHFAFIYFLLAIPAGISFVSLSKKINPKYKIWFYLLILIGLFISLGTSYGTPKNLFEKSATSELKSYINDKVGPEDLIIFDSRIYTAKTFWLATPNSFILSSQFREVYEASVNLPPEALKPTRVFFVECVIDDCGWGWVASNQNLNKSTEELSAIFSQNGVLLKSISEPDRRSNEFLSEKVDLETYKVHFLTLNLPQNLVTEAKKLQAFYFVPYMYSNQENYIFNYKTSGFGTFVNKFSLVIIYLSIVLFIGIVLFVIWLSSGPKNKFLNV